MGAKGLAKTASPNVETLGYSRLSLRDRERERVFKYIQPDSVRTDDSLVLTYVGFLLASYPICAAVRARIGLSSETGQP